jgi:hypothetical protein
MAIARLGAEVAGERLAAEAARWRAAYDGWQGAVKQSELRLVRAELKVLGSTGGLGLAKWRAACRRKRIATVQDARLKAKALRARPAVEEALAEHARVRAEGDALVLLAKLVLAEATKRLASCGSLGAELTGLSPVQLRRLARRPARSLPKDQEGCSPDGLVPTVRSWPGPTRAHGWCRRWRCRRR